MAQEIQINSVVLLGMSEQYTRLNIQKLKNTQRIVGGLMGKNMGGKVIINSSFELVYEVDNLNEISKIDKDHLIKKVQLIKKDDPYNHFRNDEFIGWYSNTPDSQYQKNDIEIHKQISNIMNHFQAGDDGDSVDKLNEETLYLTINLNQNILNNPNQRNVPMNLYRGEEKNNQFSFLQVPYTINAEKGETISIEAASSSSSQLKSKFSEKMQSTLNAVNRYNEKIEELLKLLENPQVSKNMLLMRELKEILNAYPSQVQGQLDQALLTQYSDANIMSFLSAISATNRVVQDVYSCNSNLKNSKNNYGFEYAGGFR
ncbi:hypothetical protein PPERSA_06194 [Pseudocohnilembus persalinus]|uniref:Uncharacterized protein n=1 Tax=Pseudocohnilembus persalinus TaxID=266149 RepID=A0A0V0R172_PSEPJ|nr:hypothetical protein PPERSA_06194 [Pseudocohnilembus persalinus]|eukprot:KRX08016.1 hypothetical protein PPERSA_06194 [Pseudocohnilembus persalinus]